MDLVSTLAVSKGMVGEGILIFCASVAILVNVETLVTICKDASISEITERILGPG